MEDSIKQAWTRLANRWGRELPDSFADRHQLLRDVVAVFPPDHSEAQTLREMLCRLDQFVLLQREFPFTPPTAPIGDGAASHNGGTKA